MPLGKDVGENIKQLRKDNANKKPGKKRAEKQILAISLEEARKYGNTKVKKPNRYSTP